MGAPIDAAMRPHAACRWLTEGLSFVTGKSGHRSPGYDPSHRLAGDLRDQLVVTVVMQDGDTFSFGHGRDQQVRQADRPDATASPQGALDVKRAPPVFIMGG